MAGLVLAVSGAEGKPNVIFLLTDDQGWTDRSSPADPACTNSCRGFFRTPNIDRLSRQSMNFASGYAPAPVCTPTRRSIQFGMTPARVRGTEFKSTFDPAGHLSLPQVVKKADPAYVCAHFGKWGEYMIGPKEPFGDPRGEPKNLGYDVSDGYTGNEHGSCGPKTKFKLTADEDPKRILSMTRRGVAFLEERAADSKPFYLQMSYYAIHRSPQARPSTIAKYAGKGDPRGGEYTLNLPPVLDELDAGIGEILDAMKRLGLDKNTYVFLGSDNGGALPHQIPPQKPQQLPFDQPGVPNRNAPLAFGKGYIFEGGVRVPVMACGPDVPAGAYCRAPVALYDLYATVYALAGGREPLPPEIDSADLRDVMFKGDAGRIERRTPGLVFHLPQRVRPHSAMRCGDYKVFVYWRNKDWKIGRVELYDLASDIGEKNDLSKQMPEKARELADALTAYLKGANAEAPFTARLGQSEDL